MADPLLSGALRRLIARLPERSRMIVILRFQEDLQPAEIAETLDMPLGTVKSNLHRSLAVLRRGKPAGRKRFHDERIRAIRSALRRREAPAGFAPGVMARIGSKASPRWNWLAAAVAACVLVTAGGIGIAGMKAEAAGNCWWRLRSPG